MLRKKLVFFLNLSLLLGPLQSLPVAEEYLDPQDTHLEQADIAAADADQNLPVAEDDEEYRAERDVADDKLAGDYFEEDNKRKPLTSVDYDDASSFRGGNSRFKLYQNVEDSKDIEDLDPYFPNKKGKLAPSMTLGVVKVLKLAPSGQDRAEFQEERKLNGRLSHYKRAHSNLLHDREDAGDIEDSNNSYEYQENEHEGVFKREDSKQNKKIEQKKQKEEQKNTQTNALDATEVKVQPQKEDVSVMAEDKQAEASLKNSEKIIKDQVKTDVNVALKEEEKRQKREDEDEQKNMRSGTDEGEGDGEYEEEEGKGRRDAEEEYYGADYLNDPKQRIEGFGLHHRASRSKDSINKDSDSKDKLNEEIDEAPLEELTLKNAPVESTENHKRNIEGEDSRKGAKIWDKWGKWSSCSTSCGIGTMTRWRHCVSGGCARGEKEAQIKKCTNPAC